MCICVCSRAVYVIFSQSQCIGVTEDLPLPSRQFKYRFTCRETCQGQEWGLASFPDTILSAMLGLKWAIPQSLGQSKRRETTTKKLQVPTEKLKKSVLPKCLEVCFCICLLLPRWRSLCWGWRPGVSVYAAAGRDALLNSSGSSRGRSMSRGGPGTAIVLHRITGRHTSHAIYTKQQAHAYVHTQVHIQYTHTHTSRDNELRHNKGRALDCSPVAMSFHCCWEKGDFGESHQHFHIQYI